jgi:hypothetical protein
MYAAKNLLFLMLNAYSVNPVEQCMYPYSSKLVPFAPEQPTGRNVPSIDAFRRLAFTQAGGAEVAATRGMPDVGMSLRKTAIWSISDSRPTAASDG